MKNRAQKNTLGMVVFDIFKGDKCHRRGKKSFIWGINKEVRKDD